MTPFGLPRRHVTECASTNDLARTWAADANNPAPHGALVTADYQTRGRGRRGHRWDASVAQSALMSFVLHPSIPLADAWQLGFLAALATAEALHGLGLDAKIKWPNDVLLDGCKVAGVLVETVVVSSNWAAIAGIGLNVNQGEFAAAGQYAYLPTSLRLVTGKDCPIDDVTQAVAAAFGRADSLYQRSGFDPILERVRTHLAIGATVRRGKETATLMGLNPAGSAKVCLPDGTFAEWTALN